MNKITKSAETGWGRLAKILIDVQPMTAPVGQVFTLKVKYGFGYGHGKYGIYEDEEEVRTDFGSEFGNE